MDANVEATPALEVARPSQGTDGAGQSAKPVRRRLPDERKGLVHHFSVGGHEGYLMIGLYEDGQPGEIFIRMAKAGSTIAGLMDSFGIAVSMALQYGVPLSELCRKFSHTRFEPSGWTTIKEIGYAKSLMDYLFRYIQLRFLPRSSSPATDARAQDTTAASGFPRPIEDFGDDAPPCPACGTIMVRNGTGYRCMSCGSTSGRA